MGLLELCREAFGAGDLYQVLGVRPEASANEIRRGYHRVSLRVHPDRAEPAEKERSTRHFQLQPLQHPYGHVIKIQMLGNWSIFMTVAVSQGHGIPFGQAKPDSLNNRIGHFSAAVIHLKTVARKILGKVYAVLSDEEQRALYDQQGIVDEESTVLTQDCNWEEYWRLLFKKITVKNIEDFEKKYKHSAEELEDVKAAYEDFEGDMDKIMESVLCVDYTDEPRIRGIIQHAIDSGELPSYKSFVNESKRKINARKRRAEKEAQEAEESREQMGLGEGDDDLKVLIQSRMGSRKKEMEDFVARMEAKYANKSKKGGRKATAKK